MASESFEQWLLSVMRAMEFDKKYILFLEQHRHKEDMEFKDIRILKEMIEKKGYTLKLFRSENLLRHLEAVPFGKLGFEAHLLDSSLVYFNFIVMHGDENFSQAFSSFAFDVARLRDKDFDYSPPYPKFRFKDMDELQVIVDFSIRLYEEAKEHLIIASRS